MIPARQERQLNHSVGDFLLLSVDLADQTQPRFSVHLLEMRRRTIPELK